MDKYIKHKQDFYFDDKNDWPVRLEVEFFAIRSATKRRVSFYDVEINRVWLVGCKGTHLELNWKHRFITDNKEKMEAEFYEGVEDLNE